MPDSGGRRLGDAELHFEMKAALMRIDHPVVRDLAGSERRRAVALDAAATVLAAHFREHVVIAPHSHDDDDQWTMTEAPPPLGKQE